MRRKREILEKYSFLIELLIKFSNVFPKSLYLFILKRIRNHDNPISMLIRYICLRNSCKSCGKNVAIFSNVYLFNIQNLEIGSNVSIHPMCYVDAKGGLVIGSDVSIAHSTTIMTEEHIYSDLEMNIKDQGYELRHTLIENNVWIGAGSRILAGSKIGTGTIVASGAVVKNKIPSNTIVGGIPAKVIKERK